METFKTYVSFYWKAEGLFAVSRPEPLSHLISRVNDRVRSVERKHSIGVLIVKY